MEKFSFSGLFEKEIVVGKEKNESIKIDFVSIPMIQRDYAQGRKTLSKTEVDAQKFIETIFKNLVADTEMEMDFIYGSVSKDKDSKNTFLPLDGQQRLTTLWLLHWYVGRREKQANLNFLKNFTYETRTSSRDFCSALSKEADIDFDNLKDISSQIKNMSWFHAAYRKDPTINAMLNMLDVIHMQYNNMKGLKLFARLDKLQFYPFVLNDFNLTDDLYIKMNARGKPLTSFENFKADLIKALKEKDEKKADEISHKLDTSWTDIFWKNKFTDKDGNCKIDEIYFAFLNNFFWNELFIAKNDKNDKEYILNIGKGDETSTKENENISYKYLNGKDILYDDFAKYKYFDNEIPLYFFTKLKKVFNNYLKIIKCKWWKDEIFQCSWDKDFYFISKYTEKGEATTLNQQHRIVFFAICKYLLDCKDCETENNEISLKQWMRVVWNLISGEDENARHEIRSTSAVRSAIEFIDSLNSQDVYSSLRSKKELVNGNSAFDERCKEEIEKANKILEDSKWEKKIIEAEKYAFFKGAIRFLFRGEKGEWNWDNFDRKFNNVKEYFDNNKCKSSLIELIKYCNDEVIEGIFRKLKFSEKSWLKILLDSKDSVKKTIHNFLIIENKENKVSNLTTLQEDLKNLLQEFSEIDDLRLLKEWGKCKLVLTNYNIRISEPDKNRVYEVGNKERSKFNKILYLLQEEKNKDLFLRIDDDDKIYCKGLWTDFEYKGNTFRYDNGRVKLINKNECSDSGIEVCEINNSQDLAKILDTLLKNKNEK